MEKSNNSTESLKNIKSPKLDGILRAKKLQSSPYTKKPNFSSPKTSKAILTPNYHSSTDSDEPTKEYICMICLEYLQPNNTSFTSCGHIFHQHCLKLWFNNRGEQCCPLCRNDDIFDAPLLSIQPQTHEEHYDEYTDYDDYENLQQNVMTSLFQFWPISAFTKQQPKDLWNMANRSLEYSQKLLKDGQILPAYRLLRRTMHLCDGIQFCENSNIFLKQHGSELSSMESYCEELMEKFDEKFRKFFSKVAAFQTEIHYLQKEFIERCSTKFTFSL